MDKLTEHSQVRYLEFQSDTELKDYLESTVDNLFEYNEDGKPVKISSEKDGKYIWDAFLAIMKEYNLRQIDPPSHLVDANKNPLLFTKYSKRLKLAIDLQKRIPGKPLAFRFAKKQYLKQFLNEGKIRITPASLYNDETLLETVKDNELCTTVLRHPSQVQITHFSKKSGEPFIAEPVGNIRIQSTFPTNYYVLCLSERYDPRMFDAFDADACLLIYNPNLLTQMLNEEMPKIQPTLSCTYPIKVSYLDYKNPDKVPRLTLTKDIKYRFQTEVRYIWLPPFRKVLNKISPFEIKLRNIGDFCKVIEL